MAFTNTSRATPRRFGPRVRYPRRPGRVYKDWERKERPMVRVLTLCLVALALACFVAAPAVAEDKADKDTHEGKVVSVTGNKIVMSDAQGKEHTHTLATDAKVM